MQYVTTDLEFDSNEDLALVVREFGDAVCPHLNEWIDGVYRVALGGAFSCDQRPEEEIERFCELIGGLSEKSKHLWETCTRRVLDIAFESGTEPKSITYQLSAGLVRRVSELGISIAITIYPVGSYSVVEDSEPT